MKNPIQITVELKTPNVPNFVEISSFKAGNLDEAIARSGEGLKMDVAELDNEAIERLGRQWTDALLEHAAARRVNRKG